MASPNMAAITASLERSFQKFSLNNNNTPTSSDEGSEKSTPTTSSTPNHHHHRHDRRLENAKDTTLELNSHISLPYHWEQCLDLKTGEIYYINWRNGTKATEDPRTSAHDATAPSASGDYYYDEDDEDDDEDGEEGEESSYDSEESSSENSTTNRTTRPEARANVKEDHGDGVKKNNAGTDRQEVLVVGGCKGCFMYFMVPKHVHDCPKCCGQLLHFDRSANGSL